MKKILTAIIFVLALTALNAQEYSYQITSEPGDSTFQIDVITEINPARFTVDRTTGLDSLALQRLQYSNITRLYNERARLEREIDNDRRRIATLLASLTSVGLNNYNLDQVAALDSLFVTENAVWNSRSVAAVPSYVLYRAGNTSVLRRAADNANIGTIIPRSPRLIVFNILAVEYQVGGDTQVEMYSSDGRLFTGRGASGERYVLILR